MVRWKDTISDYETKIKPYNKLKMREWRKKNPHKYKIGLKRNRDRLNEAKNKVKYLLGCKCAMCGFNEFLAALDIHHIDGNSLNNEVNNLILLCAICHRKVEYAPIPIDYIRELRLKIKVDLDKIDLYWDPRSKGKKRIERWE